MQADIKVSFMGPQVIYESNAAWAVCSNLYPSERDTDALQHEAHHGRFWRKKV
jgi:hypothetical protein